MKSRSVQDSLRALHAKGAEVLPSHRDLQNELERLFQRSLDDPPMALARARRFVEVFVFDEFHRHESPPHPPKLAAMIESLSKQGRISKATASACHAVRLEGNRVMHYDPLLSGCSISVEIGHDRLLRTLQKLMEVSEALLCGTDSIYRSSLPDPIGAMHDDLTGRRARELSGKAEGDFALGEALELLLRTVSSQLEAGWLDVLARYDRNGELPVHLPPDEENALRQLRNRGLIDHDGRWLFTPTRSKRVDPTPSGRLLLALDRRAESIDLEVLARAMIREIKSVESDPGAVGLLRKVLFSGRFAGGNEDTARRLRNRGLIAHWSYFLAGTTEFYPTELGYYVLGQLTPD